MALNYYAVLAMIPFGLAELEVLITRRQIRWRVWIALAISVAPLAVFWPLLANLKRYYGEHYLAGASLSGLIHIYGSFFVSSPPLGAAIAAAALFGILRLIAAVAMESTTPATNANTQAHEYVLVLGLLGLPSISFLVAKITHTGMTERYVLSSILGISVAAAYILPLLNRSGVTLATSFLLALLAVQEASFWVAHSTISLASSRRLRPSRALLIWQATRICRSWSPMVSNTFPSRTTLPRRGQSVLARSSTSKGRSPSRADDIVDKELIVLRSFAALHVYDFPADDEHR